MIDVGVYGHGLNAQLAACANNPDGYLAAVGDQYLLKKLHYDSGSIRNNGSSYSTGWAFSTSTFLIKPSASASISFISFMASMMQITCPFLTLSPSSANGAASGVEAR